MKARDQSKCIEDFEMPFKREYERYIRAHRPSFHPHQKIYIAQARWQLVSPPPIKRFRLSFQPLSLSAIQKNRTLPYNSVRKPENEEDDKEDDFSTCLDLNNSEEDISDGKCNELSKHITPKERKKGKWSQDEEKILTSMIFEGKTQVAIGRCLNRSTD